MTDVPRSDIFDDVYFSADDGPGETAHVFLNGNNLPARWQGRRRFTIGETGFGTGLNFLLAWELFDRTAEEGAFLDFVSVEKFPMSAQDIRKGLSPWADRLSPYLEKMLSRYPIRVPGFHRIVFDGRVALTLIFGDANDVLSEIEGSVDAWFLDGFTPSKNPDMWTDAVFSQMARLSTPAATFATFTAAGFVKRGLQAAGFEVQKQKGFGRKRDMLAGRYAGPAGSLPHPVSPEYVNILGAGLAGSACAYVLAQYGIRSSVYDPNGIASAASGNPMGIINPRFTAFRTPESDFYTAAFAQTVRSFSFMDDVDYRRCGSIHLVNDEEKQKRFARTLENWAWHDDHMKLLSSEEVSAAAGVSVPHGGLYLPDSARINPSKLCRAYMEGIDFSTEISLPKNLRERPLIYATGANVVSHPAFADFPVHTVRGQITLARASEQSAFLRTNLCYGGYVSAPVDGVHVVGSTFQKWMSTTEPLPEDDESNLQKLTCAIPALLLSDVTGHRAALRTASSDRFPIIGAAEGFSNLYVSTAHGSHGIASTLTGAHLLADLIRGGLRCLPRSGIQALSPGRFAARAARKPSPGFSRE